MQSDFLKRKIKVDTSLIMACRLRNVCLHNNYMSALLSLDSQIVNQRRSYELTGSSVIIDCLPKAQ